MTTAFKKLAEGVGMVLFIAFGFALICGHMLASCALPFFACLWFSEGRIVWGVLAAVGTVLAWGAWNLYGDDDSSGMHDC